MKKKARPSPADPKPVIESPGPPRAQLEKEMLEATRPIPGFEDTGLRYAGNEQMGYYPCIESGAVIVSATGNPIVWPTKAHLRLWADQWLLLQARQQSGIVVPQGTVPPPGQRN